MNLKNAFVYFKVKVIYAIKNDNVNDFRLIYDISDCKIKEIIIFQDFKKLC